MYDRFELYIAGYRFIGNEITPIYSSAESEAVNAALADSPPMPGARHHLEHAIELLADRQNPDYPNLVKESISAVEAIVTTLTGSSRLGVELASPRLAIHPSLKNWWLKIYGGSSDESGGRHGALDVATMDYTKAKFMAVICSAFVSCLIEESRKAQLI